MADGSFPIFVVVSIIEYTTNATPTTDFMTSHLTLFILIWFWTAISYGTFCILYSYHASSATTATHTTHVIIITDILVAETDPVAIGSSDAIIISIRTATDATSGINM